jgi:TolB-like protein/AraC-like DNA-binding protein/lipoprotein NlpI
MTEPLSMDQAFIRKLTEIVLANLSDENFSVEKLAKEAGMSRMSVHRRIKSIKHQDVSQFVREVRLKRAMEMLQNNEGTAAEIAFRVGFGSATYFNKCFHEYFGFPPGEARIMESAESLKDHADEQPIKSDTAIGPGPEKDVGPFFKSRRNKNIVITSFGVLAGLLIIYFFYVLLIQDTDHGIGHGTKHPEKSIVVLPFKNLTDDSENQYFADGIMEDILNHLFRIREMRVISRTTAEYFRGNPMTSPEIARKLSVNYVLEGSVQRYENKVRIFVQLIDARNDQHILSERFESEMTNIFLLQSNIAKRVADQLEAVLSNEEIRQIEKMPTNSPEAYDYYLKARFLVNKAIAEQRVDINREGLMSSIQYFEKAIAADKNFAEAYAGLADAWFNLSAWGWYQPYDEGIMKAKEFSMKALEINPDCAVAHAIKGGYLNWPGRRWEEGRKELLISLQLNPNYPTAHQWYAQLLMITGPIEEARIHMDRVLELEPYFWVVHNLSAWIYYFEEKHDKALEACRIAQELKSDYILTNWLFFLNYAKLGEGEKAVAELQTIAKSNPATVHLTDEIMAAYNKSGIKGLFTWLTEINTDRPVPAIGMSGQPFFTAWWFAILGDREKSLFWLERNMESQFRNYTFFNLICTNPDFDILRNDPRFLKIIDEIGLTPYNTRKAK